MYQSCLEKRECSDFYFKQQCNDDQLQNRNSIAGVAFKFKAFLDVQQQAASTLTFKQRT